MVVLLVFVSLLSPARAEICLQSTIGVTVENLPGGFNVEDVNLLFDGAISYTGEKDLEFKDPNTPGEEPMILDMGMTLLADTTFEFFYEVDDADGEKPQDYVDNLIPFGYGPWYWDYNNNGLLDGEDFDTTSLIDGKEEVNIDTGDYSPLGIVVQLYSGDPGYPAGITGTLVHTAYSPIQLLQTGGVYSFVVTAPGEFDHLVIESTPDGKGKEPRVIEIRHNGNANTTDGITYGSSQSCGLTADFVL